MENMLTQFPTGLVAVVSDSYDLMHAINHHWGETLREQVLARDGILVVRPDSGEPTEIVLAVIEALMDKFGEQTTSTGYRLLNDKVRVIQGDGITRESLKAILAKMDARKLAVGNVAFGMGAGLLQKMDRDTYSYAMKASAAQINGAWVDVYKDPVTAKGSKTSKRGRLALTWSQAKGYQTHEQVATKACQGTYWKPCLKTVRSNAFKPSMRSAHKRLQHSRSSQLSFKSTAGRARPVSYQNTALIAPTGVPSQLVTVG